MYNHIPRVLEQFEGILLAPADRGSGGSITATEQFCLEGYYDVDVKSQNPDHSH